MSTEKKKTRRNYSFIFRFIILALSLLFVFFLSFFITLAVKTHHPIDFIRTEFFESKSADKIIDDYANEKNIERHNDSNKKDENKLEKRNENETEKKTESLEKPTKTIDASTISGKFDRIQSIKQAVNEKIQDKEHYLKLDEIPRAFRQAIIAVEDSRFIHTADLILVELLVRQSPTLKQVKLKKAAQQSLNSL